MGNKTRKISPFLCIVVGKGCANTPFWNRDPGPREWVENLEGSIFRPFTSTEGTLPSMVPKKTKHAECTL
jgi:hypothetical protein